MKLLEDKVLLTEDELTHVKRANMNASPTVAGMFLKSSLKESVSDDSLDYTKVIQLYRAGKFETK